MEHREFERLKVQIAVAPAGQAIELEDLIQDIISRQVTGVALARRTRQKCRFKHCPHCHSNDIALHGKDQNGRQRFRCRGCRKTYNILTGTPMARARKPEKWARYLGFMTEHVPLRTIVASGIGVHLVTAWRWRHRFLQAASNDNTAVLSGLVEANTTFFRRSFKGSRGVNRENPREGDAAHPRAGDAGKRAPLHEQVPVLTALDSSNGVFDAVLASPTEIEAALEGRIAAGSVLCSDGGIAYLNAAEKAFAEHYAVFVPALTPKAVAIGLDAAPARDRGRLGLRRVNNYHQRLKYLINEGCRGVATHIPVHYLGWHRAMIRPGFKGEMLLERALR